MAPQDEKRSPHLACGDTQRDEGGGFQLTKNNNRETVTGDHFGCSHFVTMGLVLACEETAAVGDSLAKPVAVLSGMRIKRGLLGQVHGESKPTTTKAVSRRSERSTLGRPEMGDSLKELDFRPTWILGIRRQTGFLFFYFFRCED